VYEDILTRILNHPDSVTLEQVAFVLSNEELTPKLFAKADEVRRKYLGTEVFLRGIIEFSNYCSSNCLYCGIRAQNKHVHRYRMTPQEIVDRAQIISAQGIKTVVLQSGEDPFYTKETLGDIISAIQSLGLTITLSLGKDLSTNTAIGKRWELIVI